VLVPLGLALLTFGIRALNYPTVFREGGVLFGSADAWYHMRRIWFTVVRFPQLLGFDPYLNPPYGGLTHWTATFDGFLATAAHFAVGSGSQPAVERFVAWSPPLFGVAAVLALYALGARTFSRRAGVIAAVLLALLPAHVHFSKVGFLDHHVAVELVVIVLMGSVVALVEEPARAATPGLLARRGAWVGLSMVALLLLWPGGLLYVAIVEAFAAAFLLTRDDREEARRWAATLALTHVVAAVTIAPFALRGTFDAFGTFSPIVPSAFQPLAFTAASVLFATLFALWRSPRFDDRLQRALSAVAVAGAAAGLLLLLLPDLRTGVGTALGWFGTAEKQRFERFVAELQPLFMPQGQLDGQVAGRALSWGLYLFPFALGALVWQAWLGSSAGQAIILLWAAAAAGLAIFQLRFLSAVGPPFALILAAAADSGLRRLRRARGPRAARAAALAAVALAALLAVPLIDFYRSAVVDLISHSRAPQPLFGLDAHQKLVADVGHWIHDHTPPTRGYLDPDETPEYAVLSSWGDGHLLRYAGERPMTQDNFLGHVAYGGPETFALADRYFAATREAEALAIGDQLGIRYVVVSPDGSGHSAGYRPDSVFAALHGRTGSEGVVTLRGRRIDLPALSHHRLIHEWLPGGQPAASYRLYERVAGARVSGSTRPSAVVEARLELAADRSRYAYEQHVVADREGRYALVLPYPNAPFSDQVRALGPWELSAGDATAHVEVSERAVQEGELVEGPTLQARVAPSTRGGR